MDAIKMIEEGQKRELAPFRIGDTINVNLRIKEGEKERIQTFTGVVIAQGGGGIRETFTVRKISSGIGVERVFPIHSPMIESVKVIKQGVVRRAKLYYLRDKKGKAAKVKEKKYIKK